MIKQILLAAVAALTISSAAAGAEEIPSLGPVKVVLLKDMHTFESFVLAPVALEGCVDSVVDRSFWSSVCDITGGRRVAIGDATIDFKSFRYWYKGMRTQPDAWNQYHFYGTWTKVVDGVTLSSDVELLIWHTNSDPSDLRGWLSLKKYELSHPLQGARL